MAKLEVGEMKATGGHECRGWGLWAPGKQEWFYQYIILNKNLYKIMP
ncbi:hypothetical protein [Gorillibacterium sp. sgz5001074]